MSVNIVLHFFWSPPTMLSHEITWYHSGIFRRNVGRINCACNRNKISNNDLIIILYPGQINPFPRLEYKKIWKTISTHPKFYQTIPWSRYNLGLKGEGEKEVWILYRRSKNSSLLFHEAAIHELWQPSNEPSCGTWYVLSSNPKKRRSPHRLRC